ncbi:MAG: hypothetical protein CM15mP21_0120 [Hyphomicrobiales bacterium]|nr:MAG: hypothetical protein CM15mP21_0120 [Hyphomicrobiales bacterium]
MTRHIAVFGKMGLKYGHLIEAALDDIAGWQVDVWPCDDDLAARDACWKLARLQLWARISF